MEKIVYNLSRREAFEIDKKAVFGEEEIAWITIGEPLEYFTHVNNQSLVDCPTLKLLFWDICEIKPYINFITGEEEVINPPKVDIAIEIVDFLLANQDKHIIVNCAAGVSRSGAIAQFCQDFLGYTWNERCKSRAAPNSLLYRMMRDYYKLEDLNKYQ